MQRWSFRRVALIAASLVVLLLAGLTGVALFFPTRGTVTAPLCGDGRAMQLMAQAVPTATRLPCVSSLPYGWSVSTAETVRDKANFAVGVGDSSSESITVTLTESCPLPVPGTERILIAGGCVIYHSSIPDKDVPSFTAGGGLSLRPWTTRPTTRERR